MSNLARRVCLLGASLLLAPALFAAVPDRSNAITLGVQSCDTQCQTNETDCDLACDQVVACVEECKKTSELCAQKCRDAPPPTPKPEGSAKPSAPADKRAPPAKGTPTKPPPPKAKPKAA
jgi:hypothetical protein